MMQFNQLYKLALILLLPGSLPAMKSDPFCPNCAATRDYFHKLCDYIAAEKGDVGEIFTGGYYMRDLVAGSEIYGNEQYLKTAIAYADQLVGKQSARGYWGTGYGRIYLADTGSALGLFIVLYPHVDHERQQRYRESVQRYVDAIGKDGMVLPSGAIDVGLKVGPDGRATDPYKEAYTISSALTGGEIYTWLYHITKKHEYREVAYHALSWVLSTIRPDGVIPYNHPGGGSDLRKKNDATNDYNLWQRSLFLTSAYVGEGLISFDLYCDQSKWKEELRTRIKPHINYVLEHQNPNGTWGVDGPWDQKRSPGIVNLLTWYYDHVEKDPRIPKAVERFDQFILTPAHAKVFGMLNDGATPSAKDRISYDCVTGLTGRALADIIRPGIDAEW
ncbi:MAG TPA: hypothetical protein VGL97_14290 [Bryobacteraceae bacterium]|jgi:hypothetical protein